MQVQQTVLFYLKCIPHMHISELKVVQIVSAGPMSKRQVAANWAAQALPKQDAAGYGVHPALGDACIHLAAVPPAGEPIQYVRWGIATCPINCPAENCLAVVAA